MKFIRNYIKKRKKEKKALRFLDLTIEESVKKQELEKLALLSKEPLTVRKEEDCDDIIVSLTTYSKRIHDIHLVIESLGKQTLKANRLVLWLDEDEFSLQSIPQLLKNQIKRGLEVRFYRNIRSYKKIIPALKEFQSSKIITVDDDFLYPVDLIEILNNEEKKYKDCIIGMRAHKIKTNKKNILPYKKWTFESSSSDVNDLTFLTTGAGTLFPKSIPRHHFCLEDEFMELCPFADDVWINLISIKFGIRRKRVDDKRSFRKRFTPLQNSQDIGLNVENVHNNKNDTQIKNVIEKFKITF